MTYLEKSVEQYLRKKVTENGGLCIKQNSEAGVPDRLVLLPDGRHAFVEMKRPGGRLSAVQKEYHRRLRGMRHAVWVLWNYKEVDEFIDYYFGK